MNKEEERDFGWRKSSGYVSLQSQRGCSLLCAFWGASVEPLSHDEEVTPAWAALTGPPMMPSGTGGRSRMARRGAERSSSRHTDLMAAVKGLLRM